MFISVFFAFSYIFAPLQIYGNMDIRKNFKEITRRKGLKLYEVAELAGMRPADLSNMLNKDIRSSTAKKIAIALGVSVDELLKEDENPQTEEGTTDIESSAPAETEEGTTDIETNIKILSAKKGLKLYEVARLAGFSNSGNMFISLRRDMRLSTAQKIASALSVKIDELINPTDEPRTKTEPAKNAVFCPVCGASLRLSSSDMETK